MLKITSQIISHVIYKISRILLYYSNFIFLFKTKMSPYSLQKCIKVFFYGSSAAVVRTDDDVTTDDKLT